MSAGEAFIYLEYQDQGLWHCAAELLVSTANELYVWAKTKQNGIPDNASEYVNANLGQMLQLREANIHHESHLDSQTLHDIVLASNQNNALGQAWLAHMHSLEQQGYATRLVFWWVN